MVSNDVEQLLPELPVKVFNAVRRIYDNPANQYEIEDLTQDLLVWLLSVSLIG